MNPITCLTDPTTLPLAAGLPGGGVSAPHDFQDSLRAALLNEIELGLIVCDGRGRMRFANAAAKQELAGEGLLRVLGDSLRCTQARDASLETALRKATTKGLRQLLTLRHDGDQLMLSVVPLTLDDMVDPLVLVVLGRRGPCSALGLEMLSSFYGLTLAERRVLADLVGETSPKHIAQSRGVSVATVRTHIASIRIKFGVRNIESLLIRAAEVPLVASALRHHRLQRRAGTASAALAA